MAKQVTHKQIYRKFMGGILSRTLCGRVSHASDDANVAEGNEVINCKLCLHKMQNERLMQRVAKDAAEVEAYFEAERKRFAA